MKRSKRILCLLTAILLCLSLTACNDLDEMRANHAIRQEDGTILWNGYTYRMLEGDYTYLNVDYVHIIYATDPDVPVLLSSMEGHPHYVSKNELLLVGTRYAEETVFCREDYYQWTQEAINNGFDIESYGYTRWVSKDSESVEKQFYLSQQERKAIDRILASAPSYEYNPDLWTCCFFIYGFSKYDIFSQHICEVLWDGTAYYLRTDDAAMSTYRVPESDWAMLDEFNGGRPASYTPEEFIDTEMPTLGVENSETVYTTRSTVVTKVSGNGNTTETTKAPQTTTAAPATGNPDHEKPPTMTVP